MTANNVVGDVSHSDTVTKFVPVFEHFGLPCQYHSTNAPLVFICMLLFSRRTSGTN